MRQTVHMCHRLYKMFAVRSWVEEPREETMSEHANSAKLMHHCSFCDKSQEDVKVMVQGCDAFICDECAAIVTELAAMGTDGCFRISPAEKSV